MATILPILLPMKFLVNQQRKHVCHAFREKWEKVLVLLFAENVCVEKLKNESFVIVSLQ